MHGAFPRQGNLRIWSKHVWDTQAVYRSHQCGMPSTPVFPSLGGPHPPSWLAGPAGCWGLAAEQQPGTAISWTRCLTEDHAPPVWAQLTSSDWSRWMPCSPDWGNSEGPFHTQNFPWDFVTSLLLVHHNPNFCPFVLPPVLKSSTEGIPSLKLLQTNLSWSLFLSEPVLWWWFERFLKNQKHHFCNYAFFFLVMLGYL